MECLFNILRRLKSRIMNYSNEGEVYNMIDNFFKVLCWTDPISSFTIFLMMNYFLWMIVESQVPILGAIFIICFTGFISVNMMSMFNESPHPIEYAECCDKICNTILYVSHYRKANPLEFCLIMSLFFLILAYISSIFSGLMISFFILWSVFLTPLIYTNLPPQIRRKLSDILSSLERFQEVIKEEDLIPLPIGNSPDDNEDLESLGTDRTADSVTNSLISGISSMPSFLDAEDNHEILEEDLIPINSSQGHELTPSFVDSSDSDSELKDIRFKESHFSRESSSDEDGKFEEGLRFEETQNQTLEDSRGLVHNIVDYVTSTGGFQLSNLINNAMSSMQTTETKNISNRSSTSDEDFEIIDLEELKK